MTVEPTSLVQTASASTNAAALEVGDQVGREVRHGPARLLAVTSLAHFLNDGVVFFIPVIGDLLAQDRHVSTVLITAMLTTFYVTSAGFGIVVGLVADAVGKRGPMLAVGIATLGASLFGFYASLSSAGVSSDVLALLAAAVAGIGSSFYHPLGGSVLQLGFPASSRGRALGINGAFGSLGRALYPALFFVIAAFGISRPATTIVFGSLSILAAVLVAVGLPGDATDLGGRRSGAAEVAAPGAATSVGESDGHLSAPAAGASPGAEAGSPAAVEEPVLGGISTSSVISPRMRSRAASSRRTSAAVPRTNSSCILVSSRATTTRVTGPHAASRSARVSRIRCGAS